jgi:ArsR family transcriptional regulator, arsenate/arsenite/antimonite-responsive transcriptional repressor
VSLLTTAYLFKALSEPDRLRIHTLLTGGERCICYLMTVLDMPQPTVSCHLSALGNTGWVKGRRQGLWMYYGLTGDNSSIQRYTLEMLQRELTALRQGGEDQEKLAAYLATKDKMVCGNTAGQQ